MEKINTDYYVVYEEYAEYNQFEGTWDLCLKKFKSVNKALAFIDQIEGNPNYRKCTRPLVPLVKQED